MVRVCYKDGQQCIHVGTGFDEPSSDVDNGLCLYGPIDASNYPNDSVLCFGVRFSDFYSPNIHTVFEDPFGTVTEDDYNMDSDWTWGIIVYPMKGWNGTITSELRDGTSVRETITTTSGTIPEQRGKVCAFYSSDVVKAGANITVTGIMQNVGEVNGNFKLQIVNTDTGKELKAEEKLCPVEKQMGTSVGINIPSNPQSINLRFNVIALIGGIERLDDHRDLFLDSTCVSGQVHIVLCSDGSMVATERCESGRWVDTGNTCSIPGITIECDKPTPNYESGCALLKHYDADGNGEISTTEMQAAVADYYDDIITKEEVDFINDVWKVGDGGINKTCSGCYVALRLPPCTAPDGIGYGDIDGDGFVTMSDAEYVQKCIAGLSGYTLTDAQKIRADVNGDGSVTLQDALLIAKFATYGADNVKFPVCVSCNPPTCTMELL